MVYCISFQKMLCIHMHIYVYPISFSPMGSHSPYRLQLLHSIVVSGIFLCEFICIYMFFNSCLLLHSINLPLFSQSLTQLFLLAPQFVSLFFFCFCCKNKINGAATETLPHMQELPQKWNSWVKVCIHLGFSKLPSIKIYKNTPSFNSAWKKKS